MQAIEIPEGFGGTTLEPSDLRLADSQMKMEKLPAAQFSDSPLHQFELPRNEAETRLAQECYRIAADQFEALDSDERKHTSAGAIASRVFSEQVAVMRQTTAANQRPQVTATPFTAVQPMQPELIPTDTSTFFTRSVAQPTSAPAPIQQPQQHIVPVPASIMRSINPVPPVPVVKKRMKMSELYAELGIDNYGVVPMPPTLTVYYTDATQPGSPMITQKVHWCGVQADELGIDRTLALYVDRRYVEGGDAIPALLGRKGGSWSIQVRSSEVAYYCEVMDTRIVTDFFKIRQFTFLITRSTASQ